MFKKERKVARLLQFKYNIQTYNIIQFNCFGK